MSKPFSPGPKGRAGGEGNRWELGDILGNREGLVGLEQIIHAAEKGSDPRGTRMWVKNFDHVGNGKF